MTDKLEHTELGPWMHMPKAEYEQLHADLDGLMQESRSSTEAMDRARFKIDELRAAYQRQVEHNRFAAVKHSEHIHELGDRLNELRAEVERLHKLLETERRVARMIGDAHKKDAAEVERLRAALKEIVDHPAPSNVARVARAALA